MPVSDRLLRRLVPAVPALSRVRALMWPLDVVDRLLCLPFPEFRGLPPNRMRIRVGVGNRILFNAPLFRTLPVAFWVDALESGMVRLDSNIVDLGCGCGRFAYVLREQAFHERRFTGHYLGVDVDEEMLAWCRAHFPGERFGFHRVRAASKTYASLGTSVGAGPGASSHAATDSLAVGTPTPTGDLRLPLGAGTQDFVFGNSLFSHLLEGDFVAYLQEAVRVLRPGGWMQFSVFCLEHVDRGPGSRWSFRHALGNARVENLAYPEAAVGYSLEWLRAACRGAGFEHVEVLASPVQSMVRCRVAG